MSCINKFSIGFLLIVVGALSGAPGAVAAPGVRPAPEVMRSSGGLTLGSAALVALAGVVIAFGRADSRAEDGSEFSTPGIGGRLCTAVHEEHHNVA
jgi:hypothetical protein